jgi:hypothetical protein
MFAISALQWAIKLRNTYDTISIMGGFSKSDLVVLTNTLNQDLSDYDGPDVALVISPVHNAGASATQVNCLKLPTLDAVTRSGDFGAHIPRSISPNLCARAYLDLLAFCIPSPLDYTRVILGTARGTSAFFSASHESSFEVPSDCYTMAAHIVLGLTRERASHVRKCPLCNKATSYTRRFESSSTVSGTSMAGERSTTTMLMDHTPDARALGTSLSFTIGLPTCLKSSCLKRGLLRGGSCGLRSAVIGRELLEMDMGCGFVRLQGSTPSSCFVCDGHECSHEHQSSSFRCSSPTP